MEESRIKSDKRKKENKSSITGNMAMGGFFKLKDGIRKRNCHTNSVSSCKFMEKKI